MTARRTRAAPQRSASRAVPLPAVGTVTFDPTLTRQWRGRIARLWAAQPAYLPAEAAGEPAVFVDHAPVGTRVRIQEMYRTGPLNADIRALASPERTPELWLVAPWYALNPQE